MNVLLRGPAAIFAAALAVTAAGFAAESPSQSPVKISARVVLIEGALVPAARVALAALNIDSDARENSMGLTKAQTDTALAELTRVTGAKAYAMEPTSEAGSFRVGIDLYPHDPEALRVGITVGGLDLEPTSTTGIELDAVPQVAADGSIQLQAKVRTPVFDRFVYSGGRSGTEKGAAPGPGGCYQPVFSEFSITASGRLRTGETLVLRGETKKLLRWPSGDGKRPITDTQSSECLMMVLATTEIEPAGNPQAQRP